jgi:DNA-binding response OmpR family regulator
MRLMRAVEIHRPAVTVDVLVIEDDRLIREVLRELLASAGYGVTVAENGTEGLRRFADGRFHVVVTDVRMPGPNGWEVARRLREASADMGIIVMSASFDSEDNTRGEECCHLATLAKPFTLEQLTATIDRLVTLRQAA